jgi:hypothetical protein
VAVAVRDDPLNADNRGLQEGGEEFFGKVVGESDKEVTYIHFAIIALNYLCPDIATVFFDSDSHISYAKRTF